MLAFFTIIAGTLLAHSGCVFPQGPDYRITELSTKPAAETPTRIIRGENCGFVVVFIPVTLPSLSLAIKNALENGYVESEKVEVKKLTIYSKFYRERLLFFWELIGYYGGCIQVEMEIEDKTAAIQRFTDPRATKWEPGSPNAAGARKKRRPD
ncbi:MAG: hypothetical protein KDK33_05990 [Leptospiraceae bacterium]|nr:hypothetical protein [Leptospiraceae bacterium]